MTNPPLFNALLVARRELNFLTSIDDTLPTDRRQRPVTAALRNARSNVEKAIRAYMVVVTVDRTPDEIAAARCAPTYEGHSDG
jgi:hypothetical protein